MNEVPEQPEPVAERPAMAGYGVDPDDPEGLLGWSWAEQRLVAATSFWLVTVGADLQPHSMPVWGVWMPSRMRWGSAFAPTARKVRNLGVNDQVVVTTESTVEVVSLQGRALPAEGDAAQALIEGWVEKYCEITGSTPAEMREFLSGGSLWEVEPVRAFGMIESPELFAKAATRWVFEPTA